MNESTFEQGEMSVYLEYRDTPTTPEWVEASSNPEYEKELLRQYDASFK